MIRKFKTLVNKGNIVERLNSENEYCTYMLTTEDVELSVETPRVFNELHRPLWINKENLSVIGFKFITSQNISKGFYSEDYMKNRRNNYLLRILYELKGREETISYTLTSNFDNLCTVGTENLFIHDIQNLIEQYEND
jgi:hypothetical protein